MRQKDVIPSGMRKPAFMFLLFMVSIIPAFAQLEIEVDVSKKEWYEKPWAWVLGAVVFILLLAAILRGGRKR